MRARWLLASAAVVAVGVWLFGRRMDRLDAEGRPELGRVRCARDSDWCDGYLCAGIGVSCPNAEADA